MSQQFTKMLSRSLLLTSICYASSAIAAQADIDKIEQAAASLNIDELKQLATSLTGYDSALAYYRLALIANLSKRDKQVGPAMDKAVSNLQELELTQPENAEVKALLAQVYGYKIALNPIKAVVYGGKSQSLLAEAEQLAPNNPRVLLVKGIAAVNTPPMFGGSNDIALNAFNKAISAYEDDIYSNYHWGYAEAYTWRGLLNAKQGKQQQAETDWQKALELEPNYSWAKTLLASNQ